MPENTKTAPTIGQTLKNLRETRGYTQRQIGDVLNVSFQQIQKYETGHNRLPIEKLHALKTFYNIPFEAFFASPEAEADPHAAIKFEHMRRRLSKIKDDRLKAKIAGVLEIMMEG